MNYTWLASAAVILALIAVVVYLFQRRRPALPDEPEQQVQLSPPAQLYQLQKSEKFWGVSVESHCSESSRLAGVQFALDAAPHLPVAQCSAATCNCSYIGLPERRRTPDRRRGHDRRSSIRVESTERRADRPRRKADLVSWQAYRHL